jgi:hypothetical protein
LLRSSRLFALLAVFALLVTGCVRNKQAEPGVKAITTDLQYKELQKKSAAPANTVPNALPTLEQPPSLRPFDDSGLGPVTPIETCPSAPPTEQPDEDATNKVSRMPKAGDYLWKVNGGELIQGTIRLEYQRYVKRAIENVKGSITNGNAELTFETVERELRLSKPQTAPEVRSFFNVTQQTPDDRTVRPGMGTTATSGRTGQAGVRLVRLERKTSSGNTTTFVPSTPVRYLITPVLVGSESFWLDQVVDTSGSEPQTLTHQAYVKGRMTIDACGEKIRAWHVVADQTYSRSGMSVTRHFEYGISTQFGGILTFEHVESPCSRDMAGKCSEGEPQIKYDANIGQTEPS